MSLLEGHGDVTMDRAGADRIPSAERFSRVLRQRRQQGNGHDPAAAEAHRPRGQAQAVRGRASGSSRRSSPSAARRCSTGPGRRPANLPTIGEIRDPTAGWPAWRPPCLSRAARPDPPTCSRRCTFPAAGTEVTAAVSGGADSLALLVLAVRRGLRGHGGPRRPRPARRHRPRSRRGARRGRAASAPRFRARAGGGRARPQPRGARPRGPLRRAATPACSPATPPTTRPRRCCSTCCAAPGPTAWPAWLEHGRAARCSRCAGPRPGPCARPRASTPVDDPTNDDPRFVRNRVRARGAAAARRRRRARRGRPARPPGPGVRRRRRPARRARRRPRRHRRPRPRVGARRARPPRGPAPGCAPPAEASHPTRPRSSGCSRWRGATPWPPRWPAAGGWRGPAGRSASSRLRDPTTWPRLRAPSRRMPGCCAAAARTTQEPACPRRLRLTRPSDPSSWRPTRWPPAWPSSAREITADYADLVSEQSLVLVGVLKGAFVFMTDLARRHRTCRSRSTSWPCRPTAAPPARAAWCASSRTSTSTSPAATCCWSRTSSTAASRSRYLRKNLQARGPASLEVCALLVRDGTAAGRPRRCATSGSASRPTSWSATASTWPSATATSPTSTPTSARLLTGRRPSTRGAVAPRR